MTCIRYQATILGGIVHAIWDEASDEPTERIDRARYGPAACGAPGGTRRLFLLRLHEVTRRRVPWWSPPGPHQTRCRACARAVEREERAQR